MSCWRLAGEAPWSTTVIFFHPFAITTSHPVKLSPVARTSKKTSNHNKKTTSWWRIMDRIYISRLGRFFTLAALSNVKFHECFLRALCFRDFWLLYFFFFVYESGRLIIFARDVRINQILDLVNKWKKLEYLSVGLCLSLNIVLRICEILIYSLVFVNASITRVERHLVRSVYKFFDLAWDHLAKDSFSIQLLKTFSLPHVIKKNSQTFNETEKLYIINGYHISLI